MQLSKKRIDEDYPTVARCCIMLTEWPERASQTNLPWPARCSQRGQPEWHDFPGRCPSFSEPFAKFIELDDEKIYRKALYLMVKTMVSCRFSQQNQSNAKYADLARPFPDGQAVPAEVNDSWEQQIRQAQNGRFDKNPSIHWWITTQAILYTISLW